MLKSIFIGCALIGTPVALTVVSAAPAYAKSDEVYTSWRNNLAAGGYDVVSFHTGSPSEGSAKISTVWQNAQWQFSTRDNLESFLADPQKYAPAYGGYCAWALANDKLAKGSPTHWTIKDGRLYLNYNAKIKTRWLVDTDNFIAKGDENWPKILE